MGSQTPLLITASPTEIHKRYKKKTPQIRFHSKRPHTITKMDDNRNMESTIAGSMNAMEIFCKLKLKMQFL
jgi:hypothetical protein